MLPNSFIMKFKFTKNLDYQLDAINAIVDIFDTGKNFLKNDDHSVLRDPSQVIGNEIEIDQNRISENLQNIQKQNKIEDTRPALKIDDNNFLLTENGDKLLLEGNENLTDFSIEMETGTGKTYVYLRTILEFNKKYGLKKFIILVPSVAIREGVLKTLEQTMAHFKDLYDNVPFFYFAYDSDKLSCVRDFAQSTEIQIMIMTIQSFNSDTNVMKQNPDRFHGERPIDIVAGTRPIVIMDEPQNMETELSRSAIEELQPLFKLRYSATHKNIHNLVYRLSPVDAYVKGLVKKVEVWGATVKDAGAFVFGVNQIILKKGENPSAKITLEVKEGGRYVTKELKIKNGDDLYIKSKKNPKYEGFFVSGIGSDVGVELSNGISYKVTQEDSATKEELFRTQIRETIKAHMRKQQELGDKIKVLSLFFIDKVENYRGENAILKNIFEEEFKILQSKYDHFKDKNVEKVHNGYFSQDRQTEGRKSQEANTEAKRDKLTFNLIMKDKEKLLSFEEDLCFIFSHSALKEGWDNPNIFQICTLIQTHDDFTKRQKIGRGLRLPVDIEGNRIYDSKINVLTVIANESYEDFANTLQQEYTDAGYTKVSPPGDVRKKVVVKFKKIFATDDKDFQELWKKISQKTTYNLAINTEKLIKESIERINDQISSTRIAVVVDKIQIEMDKDGKVKTIYKGETIGEEVKRSVVIGNVVERVAKDTELTKKTIYQIFENVSNLDLLIRNPDEYIRSVVNIIEGCKNDMLVNEGLQYIPVNDFWKMELFEDFESYKNKAIKVEKSIYDHVVFDSNGEEEFAKNLETRTDIKLFAKLPHWFAINTPLGTYNPDWAIIVEEENSHKLYLVRETKFVEDLNNLRPSEEKKIFCGKKHFKAIGFEHFEVSKKKDLTDLI